MSRFRVAVEVGGALTDFELQDTHTGTAVTNKVMSTRKGSVDVLRLGRGDAHVGDPMSTCFAARSGSRPTPASTCGWSAPSRPRGELFGGESAAGPRMHIAGSQDRHDLKANCLPLRRGDTVTMETGGGELVVAATRERRGAPPA